VGESPVKRAKRKPLAIAAAAVIAAGALGATAASVGNADAGQKKNAGLSASTVALWSKNRTATPIKHVVVIFDENISFDHYFGTYPKAANTDGTPFKAKGWTPRVNGLTPRLLTRNPNLYQPRRLGPAQAMTCDQDHSYGAEQKAFDGGAMDKFVQYTESDNCGGNLYGQPGLVMDYYDGNTVTGLWNYAQNYSLNDNSYNTVFGPSTPGAINLVSGQTHGIQAVDPVTLKPVTDSYVVASPNAKGVGTVINDPDPAYDDCSDKNHTSKNNLGAMSGQNIGDLLNRKHVTWGWFQGGFRPTTTAADSKSGYAVCGASHTNVGGANVNDYSPHHNPFSYYKSTSNPHHLPPSSDRAIGYTDQANHQYDLTDFQTSLKAGRLPAVSFLKAGEYQDGHAGYSDPIDEQHFLVNTINSLQQSPEWKSTAVVIAYDDSDGWYDHQNAPHVNGSTDPANDQQLCTTGRAAAGYQDRCGYGPRLPLLVISPYARVNHVDHQLTDQSSILSFIETNWWTGRIGDGSFDVRAGGLWGMFDFWPWGGHAPKVILDPDSGAVVSTGHH
jgi:phospholipase C